MAAEQETCPTQDYSRDMPSQLGFPDSPCAASFSSLRRASGVGFPLRTSASAVASLSFPRHGRPGMNQRRASATSLPPRHRRRRPSGTYALHGEVSLAGGALVVGALVRGPQIGGGSCAASPHLRPDPHGFHASSFPNTCRSQRVRGIVSLTLGPVRSADPDRRVRRYPAQWRGRRSVIVPGMELAVGAET